MGMHRIHDFLGRVGAGDGEHRGMRGPDDVALGAEAAGDDDLAIFGEGLADRIKRLLDRRVDETAGIDHHQIGAFVAAGDFVALRAQAGQDLFGVGGGLGTAERNKADSGRDALGMGSHGETEMTIRRQCTGPWAR